MTIRLLWPRFGRDHSVEEEAVCNYPDYGTREVADHGGKGIIVVNTARGPIVDLDALHDAMRDDTVLAAGLDVLPNEPAN